MRFGCIKRAGAGECGEGHGSLDRLDMQPSCISGGLSAPPGDVCISGVHQPQKLDLETLS